MSNPSLPPTRSVSHAVSRSQTPAVVSKSGVIIAGSTFLAQTSTILAQLGIASHLADRTDKGPQIAYQKYCALLEARQTYHRMLTGGSWPGPKLTGKDLIELFVSKSFYHSHYSKYLAKVSDYPPMVEWLENSSEAGPSSTEVWGYEKANYSWQDLMQFLEDKKTEERAKNGEGKGKGKGKERDVKGKEKEKGKKPGDHKKKSANKKQVKK